jgi:FkbM family methyltransferase
MESVERLRESIPDPLLQYLPDSVKQTLINNIYKPILKRQLERNTEFVQEKGVYLAKNPDFEWYIPTNSVMEAKQSAEGMGPLRFIDFLNRGDTILEVGASTGKYTIEASKEIGPSGQLYAIEAEPSNFSCLEKNLDLYGMNNVSTHNAAISSQKGESLKFAVEKSENTTGHGFAENHIHKTHFSKDIDNSEYEFLELQTETVDTFCERLGIKSIDTLKITVNGHESEVIKGASEVLNKTRYVVLHVEYPEVRSHLLSNGFKILKKFERNSNHMPYDGPVLFKKEESH